MHKCAEGKLPSIMLHMGQIGSSRHYSVHICSPVCAASQLLDGTKLCANVNPMLDVLWDGAWLGTSACASLENIVCTPTVVETGLWVNMQINRFTPVFLFFFFLFFTMLRCPCHVQQCWCDVGPWEETVVNADGCVIWEHGTLGCCVIETHPF